jgi:HPt (histidine-containing phosphotransfer) domain-containing protein
MNIPDYSKLDKETMAKEIGLKVKHIPTLLGSFLGESSQILGRLERAIAIKDYDAINQNAHSVKESAGNLRFNEIYEMAKAMELAAKESDSSFAYEETFTTIKKGIATICI